MAITAHNVKKASYSLTEKNPIDGRVNDHIATAGTPVFDMHYPLEAGIVLSGSMTRHYQEGEIVLEKNDIWLCGTWQPHGYKLNSPRCSVLVLMFLPEMLHHDFFPEAGITDWLSLFMTYSGNEVKFSDNDQQFISLKKRLIDTCSRHESPFKNFYLHLGLLELLALIREKHPMQATASCKKQHNADTLLPALHLVYNQTGLITLDDAAQACGLSSESFRRKFKDHLNISFSQFALRYRIQQVARTLITTNEPIKAIANQLGFTDSSHLHRLFLRFYNQTPKEFRSQNQ